MIPLLLLLLLVTDITVDSSLSYKIVGYVGPACVVVDDSLYLHGIYSRKLGAEEILVFKKYQNTLSLLKQLKEAVAKGSTLLNNGSISLPTPTVPTFCERYDDSPEVILNGCTVRNNYVYMDDKLIRPLNELERQKILLLVQSFDTQNMRSKRQSPVNNTTELPETTTTTTTAPSTTQATSASISFNPVISEELKEFISQALNINNNVTEKFIPTIQLSPLMNQFGAHNIFPVSHDDAQEQEKQHIKNFIQDHIMKYQSRKTKAYDDLSKVLNGQTTTEIPHIMVDQSQAQQNMYSEVNAEKQHFLEMQNNVDPFVLQLLQTLATNQQMANLYEQQMAQARMNQLMNAATKYPGAAPMKPGDVMNIGGQSYVAVPLNMNSNGVDSGSVGLVPAPRSANTHTVTMMPPVNNNPWAMRGYQNSRRSNVPLTNNNIINNMITPDQLSNVRYHPKRKPQYLQVPSHVNGVPLPHEICRIPNWSPTM